MTKAKDSILGFAKCRYLIIWKLHQRRYHRNMTFNSECARKRLSASLCVDPLGNSQCSVMPRSWIWRRGPQDREGIQWGGRERDGWKDSSRSSIFALQGKPVKGRLV